MITDEVITEIYHKYNKPHKQGSDLQIDYFMGLLKPHHNLHISDDEMIIDDLEEFNPFRRFLMRSLNTILEFDKMIAFVFNSHILFFGKDSDEMRIHLKPEEKKSFFRRLFGG